MMVFCSLQVLLKAQHRVLEMTIFSMLFGLTFHRMAWASIPSDWRERFDPETLAIQEEEPEWHNLHGNDIILEEDDGDSFRNPVLHLGRLGKDSYWPNNGQRIPYKINHSAVQGKQNIEDALGIIEKRTGFCITFEPRSREREYIRFQPGERTVCSSNIGRRTGRATTIILGMDCLRTDVIQHEILHALGFFHEQNRPDRDEYIDIDFGNIRTDINSINYDELPEMVTYGLPYDYNSIMHYGPFNMSRISGRPTIVPKRGGQHKLGQTHGLSILDVARLQLAYNCSLEHLASERSTKKYPQLKPAVSHVGERSDPETPAIQEGQTGQHNRHGNVNLGNAEASINGDSGALSGRLDKAAYWPNNGQEIPYAADRFDSQGRHQIENALRIIEQRTGFCITFKERSNEREYIRFQPGRGCTAEIGRKPGQPTRINLNANCMTSGSIQHEIIHALGFFHEQNRPDRDEHIVINSDNMISDIYRFNYQRMPAMATYGLPYDFNSIMHFGPFEMSKTLDLPVIVSKRGPQNMGQRQGLSTLDVTRLQLGYNCSQGSSRSDRVAVGDSAEDATFSPRDRTNSRGNSRSTSSFGNARNEMYDDNDVYFRIVAELKKLTNDKGLKLDGTSCSTFLPCSPIFKIYLDNERPSANFPEAPDVRHYTEIYRDYANNSPNLPRTHITWDYCGIHDTNTVLRVIVDNRDRTGEISLINNFDCRVDGAPAQTETVAPWHDDVCTARKQRDKMKLTFRYKIFAIPRHRCVRSSGAIVLTTTRRRQY